MPDCSLASVHAEASHSTQVDVTSSIRLIAALGSQASSLSVGILGMLWISRSALFLIMYAFSGELEMYLCWLLITGVLSR